MGLSKDVRNQIKADNARRPKKLQRIPSHQWPPGQNNPSRVEVWISRYFLAQIFEEGDNLRVSVNRTMPDHTGQWLEGITWEELQSVKAQLGLGHKYAIEIYPPDEKVVNVANMRHLWVLLEPLNIGW